MKLGHRRLILWTSVVGIMAAIFLFSAQNGVRSGALSDAVAGSLYRVILRLLPALEFASWQAFVLFVRKAAHFTCYCLLSVASFSAFSCDVSSWKNRSLYTFLLCVAYAASDEWHQSFVPGRAMRATDVLIDSCGAVIGIGLCLAWLFWRKKRNTSA